MKITRTIIHMLLVFSVLGTLSLWHGYRVLQLKKDACRSVVSHPAACRPAAPHPMRMQ